MKPQWQKFVFSSLVLIHSSALACPEDDLIENSYIVQKKSESSPERNYKSNQDFLKFVEKLGGHVDILKSGFPGSQKLFNQKSRNTAFEVFKVTINSETVTELLNEPNIYSVEPDCRVQLNSIPNDPHFSINWAHELIQSVPGWKFFHNAEGINVAIIDTGVDIDHEDLVDNLWVNSEELEGLPEFDDDGNGCIDDIHGCDIADNDGDPRPGRSIMGQHGTHVAGIIGAVGNNKIGVTGISWKVKLMAIKAFSNESSSASLSDLLKSIYYAVDNGADIINCSWGSKKTPSLAEVEAFQYAISKNVLPVVAAGNQANLADFYSPASIPGVLTVGSVNSMDEMSRFSNYGQKVHILAPGGDSSSLGGPNEAIYSTLPKSYGLYGSIAGTSMAAPFVSGLAALIKAIKPNANIDELKSIILASADVIQVTSPVGSKYNYPRLNVKNALEKALFDIVSVNQLCQTNCDLDDYKPVMITKKAESNDFGTSSCSFENNSKKASFPYKSLFIFLLIAPLSLIQKFKKN